MSDSVHVVVTREIPDGTKTIVYDQKIRGVRNTDSIELVLSINPFTDKGSNKIHVSIDPENNTNEICETNNIITKEFFIFEDEIRPVYPYNYSIINKQNITYYGSTANPLGTTRKYYFEIDTTQSFNSSLKKIDSVNSVGGSISVKPSGINFADSTVYYWRLGMRPTETSAILWNNFSFVYIAGTETGFNQSHYFQHQQSSYKQIFLDPNSRIYKYDSTIARLQVRTGIYPYHIGASLDVSLNYNFLERYGCRYGTFQFYVFDGKTLQNWTNKLLPNGEGKYRSAHPACNNPTEQRLFFEYYYHDPVYRKRAMDFMDSVKDGDYVVVTNLGWTPGAFVDASVLKSDEAILGAGNSIYHKLKNAGFGLIDSFKNTLPMIFIYKKNDPSFTPVQHIGITNEQITEVVEIPSYYTNGTIESPWFGPSKSWKELIWKGTDREPSTPDTTSIDIIGKTNSGIELLLATVKQLRDTSLTFINPLSFPYVKLRINNMDNVNVTPHQLKSWMILADYVPEGAVAPNLTFRFQDTVELGQPLDFAIAFKNVSETAFDSLKLKLIITNRNNVPKQIILPKKKPLLGGDSIVVSYQIDTKDLAGLNTLYLMVNPDNDQQEQFLFNNFVFKSFYVKADNYKPWLDVTFDGTHILNQDIVSSKPHILVKLKDESRFMALSDTAGMKIQIRYPGTNGAIVDYKPNSDSVRFTPANLANNAENAASIDLFPTLNEDGEYELTVSGTDRSGNKAGDLEYKVAFQVINKPMISNLLNYPNPFTTSTAFVFTITGSEIPQNIRIQILTITGKVVREITKAELGSLRVGRNITDFKWDGTDQYGNKLANGIYLYRVITNHNGKALDKYKATDDNTDQYFNKGYGKMYLMR
ncbi:MAG: FlgD immunoglobulin-like domain containing protein [Lacibacter sp.]